MKFLAIVLLMTSPYAFAQVQAQGLGKGIVNAAGTYGHNIGTVGAGANRQAANNLFQQGLNDEAQGFATLNVGLLSKALTEGLSGVQADDQSRRFGQASMQALQSGGDSGNVVLSKYGTSEDQIRDFANNSSPLMPSAQHEFDRFGIQVNHDKSLLQTPYGNFPLNTSIDDHVQDLAKIISSIAEAHGLSSKDVMSGIKSGLAARDAIAAKAMEDAQKRFSTASDGGATGAPAPAANSAPNAVASAAPKPADQAAAKRLFWAVSSQGPYKRSITSR